MSCTRKTCKFSIKYSIFFVRECNNVTFAFANFEFLLKKVENNYFMFADQDDIWLEDKVKKSVENMTGLKVLEVNVHVQGVKTERDNVEDDEEKQNEEE